MFDKVNFIFRGSEETGYGQHAKYFGSALRQLLPETPQNPKSICNIILGVVGDQVFYDDYEGVKIAFNVWESTRYPEDFFQQLLTFDQLWVPSHWQKECTIEQGFPEDRVKVIPEGVDGDLYKPSSIAYSISEFEFIHVGKWEDRKSTREIIETFLKTFPKDGYPNVTMKLFVDTWFPVDNYNSTEERLKVYGFDDDRLIIHHFSSKEKYLNGLRTSNCFVSCARAEGWNLPLIEAIACGIPSICSGYGAQLDFHSYPDLQVEIKEHRKPVNVYGMPDCPGTWSEPNYEDLSLKMMYAFEKRNDLINIFRNNAEDFRKKWSWENAAKIAVNELEILYNNPVVLEEQKENLIFNTHFVHGAFVELKGNTKRTFKVYIYNKDTGKEIYSSTIRRNNWHKVGRVNDKCLSPEYFVNYKIVVKDSNGVEVFRHDYDAKGKRVFICFESTSLGDTIAWFPYCIEFQKKHQCKLIVMTFHNYLFEKVYPEIEFVKAGDPVPDIYAQYNLGVYHEYVEYKHVRDWRTIPLQQIAADILGIEYREIKPSIDTSRAYSKKIKRPKKYVCISEHSTAMCKYWHYPNGWQELVDYINSIGYNVVGISSEHSGLKDIIHSHKNHIDITMATLMNCECFIGLASGLAWLAWALNKPVVMISGFSSEFCEFQEGNIRIVGKGDCVGCLQDIFVPDRAWDEGCFHNKDFSCTKLITTQEVIDRLPLIPQKKVLDFTTAPILRNSKRQTSFKMFLNEIDKFNNPTIVEIGTMRRELNDPELPGDGNSTSIFSWYVKNYKGNLTAVDINSDNLDRCKKALEIQGYYDEKKICLINEDGLKTLEEWGVPIHAIYIDAFDYDKGKEKESEEFHLKALQLAEERFVVGTVVMFDDCFNADYKGKGHLAIPYALESGNYEKIFHGYQVILRRIK